MIHKWVRVRKNNLFVGLLMNLILGFEQFVTWIAFRAWFMAELVVEWLQVEGQRLLQMLTWDMKVLPKSNFHWCSLSARSSFILKKTSEEELNEQGARRLQLEWLICVKKMVYKLFETGRNLQRSCIRQLSLPLTSSPTCAGPFTFEYELQWLKDCRYHQCRASAPVLLFRQSVLDQNAFSGAISWTHELGLVPKLTDLFNT